MMHLIYALYYSLTSVITVYVSISSHLLQAKSNYRAGMWWRPEKIIHLQWEVCPPSVRHYIERKYLDLKLILAYIIQKRTCWRSFHENNQKLACFILSKTLRLTLNLRWILEMFLGLVIFTAIWLFKTPQLCSIISWIRLGVPCSRFPTFLFSHLSKWSYWPIKLAHKLFLIDELSSEAEDSSGGEKDCSIVISHYSAHSHTWLV